jgi:hypothetical protein
LTTPTESTQQQPVKRNRLSKKKKKNLLSNEAEIVEGQSPVAADQDTALKM